MLFVKLTFGEFICNINRPLPISSSDIEDILGVFRNGGAEVRVLLELVYQLKREVGIGHGFELLLIGRSPVLAFLETLVASAILNHSFVNG